MKVKDLSGQVFGKLTAIAFSDVRKGHAYWLCYCECGGFCYARGSHLLSGNVSSCGCAKGNVVHKKRSTRLYSVWANMKSRCLNPKDKEYHRYGGRGIEICDEWKHDFQEFYDWSIANGYDESAPRGQCTIDRINNDGMYCPENCRWATAKVQANNTSRTRIVEFDGEKHSISEWARMFGMNRSTLSMRINKYGWSVEDALRKDVRKYVS